MLFFPPPTEVFIYVSTIYLQSSGVIYILLSFHMTLPNKNIQHILAQAENLH